MSRRARSSARPDRGARNGVPKPREGAPPRDFLLACLNEWSSSLALHRAIELRKLWRYPLTPPVLDVGCGDGTFTSLLLEPPVAAGVDANPDVVAKARATGLYRQAVVADARRMPFRDREFATVYSNCVLEHIDGLDAALVEFRRVLRPGGLFIATVPTPRWESDGPFPELRRIGLDGISDRINDSLRRSWHHVNLHEPDEWRRKLARAGFRMMVWEPYMTRQAYASFGHWMPTSSLSQLTRRLLGRSIVSRRLRAAVAPLLARWLRRPYLSEDAYGTNGMFLAVRR